MTDNAQGTFNQAGYSQERLHEIFTKINRCSVDLFTKSFIDDDTKETGWNYNIVFNHLNSVVSSICSKFNDDEMKEMDKVRRIVRDVIRIFPPYKSFKPNTFSPSPSIPISDLDNQDKISEALFQYKVKVEQAMEAHGIGNPSKLNPSKAAIN